MRRLLCSSLLGCTLGWSALQIPLPPANEEALLQRKAQSLTDACLGSGQSTVVVTLRQGQGVRRSQKTVLGERGFVVAKENKREAYNGSYENEVSREKMEIPREALSTTSEKWTESIDVAVVVKKPKAGLESLLEAGLGMRPERGDRVVVMAR